MERIQVILGDVMLVAVAIAAILGLVILVLLEAQWILGLWITLRRQWRTALQWLRKDAVGEPETKEAPGPRGG